MPDEPISLERQIAWQKCVVALAVHWRPPDLADARAVLATLENVALARDATTKLAEAVLQLLSDMGEQGQCVSGAAKALARVACEPFGKPEDEINDDIMSLAEAQRVMRECDL